MVPIPSQVAEIEKGAAPEVIDTDITETIEGAVASIAGIRSISSESRQGRSRVTIEFEAGQNVDVAANDVRDAVGRAGPRRLATRAHPPVHRSALHDLRRPARTRAARDQRRSTPGVEWRDGRDTYALQGGPNPCVPCASRKALPGTRMGVFQDGACGRNHRHSKAEN